MRSSPTRVVAGLALLLLAACVAGGERALTPEKAEEAVSSAPTDRLPEDATVVLQVVDVGGYISDQVLAGRPPLVTVYADGRVITEGPVPAIWPPPALPNLQLHRVDEAGLRELLDRAVAAGLTETGDLGSPKVTDNPSTRFVLRKDGATATREAYALGYGAEPAEAGRNGLTDEQVAARDRLVTLLGELRDPAGTLGADRVTGPEPYEPEAVAGVVGPYYDVDPPQPEQPWPGPDLPGVPRPYGVTCVAATGTQAQALLEAAASASAVTPWVSADGARWEVLLRPLLPHETGCADLPPG